MTNTNREEITLEAAFYEQVRRIADALRDGALVWGGGVGAEKRGDKFVVTTPDEAGEEALQSFDRAINCAWAFVQYVPGVVNIDRGVR